MPGHYSISGQEIFTPVFDQLAFSIRLSGGSDEEAKLFSRLIDSIQSNGNANFEIQDDLSTITSLYLIKNIDLAFLAYNRIPEKGREEHVFLLDEKGNQYWSGVTSVNHIYKEFLTLERLCE